MKIAVVGGDLRQCYLAKTLLEAGCFVKVYGLECKETGRLLKEYEYAISDNLNEAIEKCDAIVLPTPVSEKWFYVSELLWHNTLVFGWNIPKEFEAYKRYDFGKMEEVALRNAVATAEGTLAEIITNGVINLTGSKCIVTGYGRCGKEIAARLRQIGVNVTVMARNAVEREDAAFHGMDISDIFDRASYREYDFVVNTIPARVIGKPQIDKLSEDVVIIDIATMPGGTDFTYCKNKGIKALHSLGLPGKYSPKTSGWILGNAVLNIIYNGRKGDISEIQ